MSGSCCCVCDSDVVTKSSYSQQSFPNVDSTHSPDVHCVLLFGGSSWVAWVGAGEMASRLAAAVGTQQRGDKGTHFLLL